MSQEEKDKVQKVGIYQSCLSMENSLLQSYRTLFLTIEVILLALGIALLTMDRIKYVWMPAGIGMIFCFASIAIFSWGRKRVDYWRDRIFEEIKGIDLEKIFEIYRPIHIWRIPSLVSPRFWFDVISPLTIGIAWLFLVGIAYLQ